MPQNKTHVRNKIKYHLTHIRKSDILTQSELDEALERAGVHSKEKQYTEDLEEDGTLRPVRGGWKISDACYQTGRITVTVSPAASLDAVQTAVSDAVRRFRPLATVRIEP